MRTFTAVVPKEETLYVAECPKVGTASQGETIEEAVRNLQEATDCVLRNLTTVRHLPLFLPGKWLDNLAGDRYFAK